MNNNKIIRAEGMINYYQYTVITHRYKKQLAQHTIQWKSRVVKVANMSLIVRNAYTYKSVTALLFNNNVIIWSAFLW